MRNLIVLDLSFNQLTEIRVGILQGLELLQELHLIGNQIMNIEPLSFSHLKSLPVLKLSGMKIQALDDFVFKGLATVLVVDLSNNIISTVSDDAFTGMDNLVEMYLQDNPLKVIKAISFRPLMQLTQLESSHFKLCCMAVQVLRENCYPPQDPISSCEDLMNNNILRTFIWILGIMAFVGNIVVVIWRSALNAPGVPDLIITNLAFSDLLMGFYLLILAGVDLYYKGVFIEYSDIWREHWLCKISGFFATFSCEASVMFLAVLTIDRFINIIFPFSDMKFTKAKTRMICAVVWFLGFLVSVAPFIPIDYFGGNYYGRSGVCMALPITNERPAGIGKRHLECFYSSKYKVHFF